MSYELSALISSVELAEVVAAEVPVATVVRLDQGLAVIPMTERLVRAVHDPAGAAEPDFRALPGGFGLRIRAWSKAAPIAYVEAGDLAAEGDQRAVLWVNGVADLGPLRSAAGEPHGTEGSPIAQVLRRLGVRRQDTGDELDAVGLTRHHRLAAHGLSRTQPTGPADGGRSA